MNVWHVGRGPCIPAIVHQASTLVRCPPTRPGRVFALYKASERPEGALRLRGLLVPSSSESETATWRGVDTTQVLGWMSQHTGTQRLQSLWVRTAHAWYWLRRKDLFAPAHIYRPFWTLPGIHLPHKVHLRKSHRDCRAGLVSE